VKRLFWLGLGVAAGVGVTRKLGQAAHKATPAGIAENLSGAARELAGALGSFGAEVRAGMTEREDELHRMVEQRSGVPTKRHVPSPAPRAPRAGGSA
jgi:hypothetical protein